MTSRHVRGAHRHHPRAQLEIVTADGNRSFAEAVRRKLLLEIAGRPPARKQARRGG